MQMPCKPNVFLVGAAKCGTSALNDFLHMHPEIFAAKEPNYLCRDLFPPNAKSLSEAVYASHFQGWSGEPFIMDSSVFYLYSATAAKDIKSFNPDAKILIQLRNPLEVLPSHHSQLVFEQYEKIESFEAAIAEEDRRKKLINGSKTWGNKILLYRNFVHFSTQVKRYFDVFGRENVHVSIFDDYKADIEKIYGSVLEFLGVKDTEFKPFIDLSDKDRQNANRSMKNQWVMTNFVRDPPQWISVPAKLLFPLKARNKLKKFIRAKNTVYHKREAMPDWLYEQLRVELTPEVKALSALLDRDLMHWVEPRKRVSGD